MPRRLTKRSARPDDILADHSPEVRKLATRVRALIHETVPEASEVAYPGWHAIGYRHPTSGYFCGIFPTEDGLELGFEWGALLHDPDVLLHGGKQVRYLIVKGPKDIRVGAIRKFLLEAIALKDR